jgi:hypothetical protein
VTEADDDGAAIFLRLEFVSIISRRVVRGVVGIHPMYLLSFSNQLLRGPTVHGDDQFGVVLYCRLRVSRRLESIHADSFNTSFLHKRDINLTCTTRRASVQEGRYQSSVDRKSKTATTGVGCCNYSTVDGKSKRSSTTVLERRDQGSRTNFPSSSGPVGRPITSSMRPSETNMNESITYHNKVAGLLPPNILPCI